MFCCCQLVTISPTIPCLLHELREFGGIFLNSDLIIKWEWTDNQFESSGLTKNESWWYCGEDIEVQAILMVWQLIQETILQKLLTYELLPRRNQQQSGSSICDAAISTAVRFHSAKRNILTIAALNDDPNRDSHDRLRTRLLFFIPIFALSFQIFTLTHILTFLSELQNETESVVWDLFQILVAVFSSFFR